jgi:hypothetical protein
MVLPRESAAVTLKYRRWDLNLHPLYGDRILSPVRVPYSWYWRHVGATLKASGLDAVRMQYSPAYLIAALG